MATYGTIQRPSTLSSSASIQPPQAPPSPTHNTRNMTHFTDLLQYYNIPPTPEAAAVRVVRNFRYFGFYYTLLVWLILFVSLIPRRRVSLIFLIAMTAIACLYMLLLRAVPDSVVLHRVIDRRLVLALLVIVTIVELVITRAAIHLLVSIAIGAVPVFVHAVLRMGDDLYVTKEASAVGELIPFVRERAQENESSV